ncbi:MAG: radical SAM protein [Janthinobacterium lividum]
MSTSKIVTYMLGIVGKSTFNEKSIKYLFTNNINEFEAVYFRLPPKKGIPYGRYHICILSQSGCAQGCKFCSTGYMGFFSNLTSEEMLGQIDLIREDIIKKCIETLERPFSSVIMGMGEPLTNVKNVIEFCYKANKNYRNLEKIAISTVGVSPNITKLANIEIDIRKIHLFCSIHSPYDNQRTEIMPINSRYNIDSVLSACKEYSTLTSNKVTVSYLLFKDYNDSIEHAHDLAALLDPNYFDVQLLLFNDTDGNNFKRPNDERGYIFEKAMRDKGIDAYVRISEGRDVNGGCGQLISRTYPRRNCNQSVMTNN